MKNSHKAVWSALAIIVVLAVGGALAAHAIISQIGSGAGGTELGSTLGDTSSRSSDDANVESVRHPVLTGFDRLDARGAWNVQLTQGQTFDVQLTYPARLKDQIKVEVENGRLILSRKNKRFGWFGNHHGEVKATVVMPALTAVDLAGAGQVTLVGFSGNELSISIAGAAEVKGSNGRYDRLQLIVNGASHVNLAKLPVHDAHVMMAGAGNVVLDMQGGSLSGTLSGVGELQYHGSVSEQSVMTTGLAHVEALD